MIAEVKAQNFVNHVIVKLKLYLQFVCNHFSLRFDVNFNSDFLATFNMSKVKVNIYFAVFKLIFWHFL